MNIAHWLYQTALARPDAPALRNGEELVATYRDFADQVDARARLLADQGLRPGDRVALFAKNAPEYLEALYAIWWAGGVAVPINAKLHPREAGWIAGDAGVSVMITDSGAVFGPDDLAEGCRERPLADPALLGQVPDRAQAPVARLPDDLAWLFYTSGTTGRPKGVMLSHRNLMMMSLAYATDVDQATASDHVLYAAPVSHGAGLYNFPLVRAGACHVFPASGGFDPAEIETLAGRLGNLVFFAAPTMVRRLIDAARTTGFDGTGIKTIIYGGGPMYAADIDAALTQFGPRFVQIYGQGEAPMTITALPRDLVADTTHPDWRARRASVGFAQVGVRVRVVDGDLNDLPPGTVGEIVVAGDVVMQGYWNRPDATRDAITDGWLRTGDLGALDAEGFLTLTDRSKDVIISGGTNIYPREVEEVLLRHPAVSEVSVIGAPDPEWGEQVVAFVVRVQGATCGEDELNLWCKAEIASFKKPKRYEFVSDLPKNSYGKVLKTQLREGLK